MARPVAILTVAMALFGGDGFREQVRDATDLAELVRPHTALRPSGPGRYSGLCPFHSETAPSFQVDAGRGFFHCFGCKESGDAFSFLMKLEGLSFPEALERLALKAGIPIPRRDPERASQKDRLRAANRKALAHFRRTLLAPAGAGARAYLERRGLSESMIEEQGLGFAAANWDDLSQSLAKAGVPAAVRVEAGLAREGRRGDPYDFFRGRVIFPILDGQGRPIGFAGRSLGEDEPKYLNSPDSPIYRKRSVLYGWNHARAAIRRERFAILCEGYFDCLSAWQVGIRCAVAVCGTALTPDHARQLRAQAQQVIVAFDGDASGRKAVRRSLPVLLESGIGVRVARLPEGKDPDEVIRADGGVSFRERLETAPTFVTFLAEEARRDARDPAAAARAVLEVIASAPSPLDREAWLKQAAAQLGFSVEAAAAEMRQLVERRPRVRPRRSPAPRGDRRGEERAEPPADAPRNLTPSERDLIRWVEKEPVAVARILSAADPEIFAGLGGEVILLRLKAAADNGAESVEALLSPVAARSAEMQAQLREILTETVPLAGKQTPQDCFDALRLRWLRQSRLPQLQAEIGRAELAESIAEAQAVTRRVMGTMEEIDRLLRGPRRGSSTPPDAPF